MKIKFIIVLLCLVFYVGIYSQTATITTLMPSNIGYDSLVCGGNVSDTGGSNVTERGVCWNITGNPTIFDNKLSNGSGLGTFLVNITSLLANQKYYLRAYAINGSGVSYGSEVSVICRNDWTGGTSRDWNNSSNWGANNIPDKYTNVVIPNIANSPIILSNAEANRVVIETGGILTINASRSLTVYDSLIIDGGLKILSDMSGVGIIITRNGIGGINKSNCEVEIYLKGQTIKDNLGKFHYVSSPVNGAVSDSFPDRIYYYDETNVGNVDDVSCCWVYANLAGSYVLDNGRGYAASVKNTKTIRLVGELNDGDYNYLVTNSGKGLASDGWNMVGNPYPSAIDANAFISDAGNSHLSGSLYFWDDDNSGGGDYSYSDYAIWNGAGYVGGGGNKPNGYISPGQGFFVKANSSGNVVFKNSMRTTEIGKFFKLNNDISRVYLYAKDLLTNNYNEMLIAFKEDATDGYDNQYDALKLKGNQYISFYSLMNGQPYAIQTFPKQIDEKTVDIGLTVGVSGNYRIGLSLVENIENKMNIYLYDKVLDKKINLKKGFYEFYSNSGIINNRFSVIFSESVMSGLTDSMVDYNNIKIIVNDNEVLFYDIKNITKISLIDIMGKEIGSYYIDYNNNKINITNLSKGVYIIVFNNDRERVKIVK